VSWQIIPTALTTLMSDPDAEKGRPGDHAMLKMKKIVTADFKEGVQGRVASRLAGPCVLPT